MKKRLLTEVEFYTIKAEHMGYVIANTQDYKIFKAWFDEQENKKIDQEWTVITQEKTTVGKAVITLTTPFYVDADDEFERANDYGTADHESLILSLF